MSKVDFTHYLTHSKLVQLNIVPKYLKNHTSCFILARLNSVLKRCEINLKVVCHFKTQVMHGCVKSIGYFLASEFLVF